MAVRLTALDPLTLTTLLALVVQISLWINGGWKCQKGVPGQSVYVYLGGPLVKFLEQAIWNKQFSTYKRLSTVDESLESEEILSFSFWY